jgi:hypothetical protein
VQGEWKDEWFNRWNTRLIAKYANDYTHYKNYDVKLLPSDNEYVQQEIYLSWANKVRIFNWWDLSVAYDYQFNTLARENLLLDEQPESFSRHSHWLSAATAFNVKEYLRLQASVLMTAVSQEPKANSQQPVAAFAADPIIERMTRPQLEKSIQETTRLMKEAAKRLDFLQAAQYRDEIIRLQKELELK